MTSIDYVTLEVDDTATAEAFYTAAFGPDSRVRVRASQAATSGFRGFTLSLAVSQPADVRHLFDAAVAAGATPVKEPAKSMWGVGGAVRAPDGTIWNFATPKKKDSGPASRAFSEIVLLIGAADVGTSKKFYVDHGLAVGKSFGNTYVEFALPDSPVKFGLYGRRGLAKSVDVSADGSGSHRIAIGTDAEPFTDPDGFAWEPAS
jgi:hypothetical protein